MLHTINKKTKAALRYHKSINNLYSMYCEMSEEPETLDNVFDKAKFLDDVYYIFTNQKPTRYNDVRMLIIHEYKEFNPEYGKPPEHVRKMHAFSRDFVASELARENCILTSDYINCKTPITYKHEGRNYYVSFHAWRHEGFRPHKCCSGWRDEIE